jgi:hypothetical protein
MYLWVATGPRRTRHVHLEKPLGCSSVLLVTEYLPGRAPIRIGAARTSSGSLRFPAAVRARLHRSHPEQPPTVDGFHPRVRATRCTSHYGSPHGPPEAPLREVLRSEDDAEVVNELTRAHARYWPVRIASLPSRNRATKLLRRQMRSPINAGFLARGVTSERGPCRPFSSW